MEPDNGLHYTFVPSGLGLSQWPVLEHDAVGEVVAFTSNDKIFNRLLHRFLLHADSLILVTRLIIHLAF